MKDASAGLAARVRGELKSHVDAAFREGMLAFFREEIQAWGVRGPEVKRIAADVYRQVKRWPAAEREQLFEKLWRGRFEEGAVAIYVCRRFRREFGAREFRVFERWIDRYVRNWAHCDGVSSWLLSGCIENQPALIARLDPWTRSRNRWKRRAAAVALLQEAKQGRNTEAILRRAEALLGDADDMVQKGAGWLLKETYPRRPREVVAFLEPRQADTPRLLLRYAAEKMTAADRALIGLRTRPAGAQPKMAR